MHIMQIWEGPFGYFYSYDDAMYQCDACSDPEWSKPKEAFALVGDYTDTTNENKTRLFVLTPIEVS